MCDETKLERKTGAFFARRLVMHLLEMGAAQGKIPVSHKGKEYIVEVRKVPTEQLTSKEG